MSNKTNLREVATKLVADLKEFSIVANEPCPEGHRKDPKSGACLPMGSTDHTAFTRSVNDDQGDLWRGLKDKAEETKEEALDASDMDEFESCAAGTMFSFVQRKCVTSEEADAEDAGERAFEEVSTGGGHSDVVMKDPEGRRDPVGFNCPSNQFFDYKRRECIPLNKDTVLASEDVDADFKQEVANGLSGRLAVTSPDPLDGHKHLVTVDTEGNGKTSVSSSYSGSESYYHSHNVKGYEVQDYSREEYTSKHFGHVIPKEMWEYEEKEEHHGMPMSSTVDTEAAKELKSKQRTALPDSAFGVPGKRKFPLHDCSHVRNAMARFNQAKGLTPGEKATLRRKILSKAKGCGIDVKKFGKASTAEEFATIVRELELKERVMSQYSADADKKEKVETEVQSAASKQGPCPPGMEWDGMKKGCKKMKGFYDFVKSQASHSEIVALDPAGRKDPVGFQCPSGSFFNFATRMCVPLDPSRKEGTTTTKAATEDSGSKVLAPNPAGRPARLPSDCPAGTIWDGDLEDCKPLDSRKKTKSEEVEEDAKCAPKGKKKMKSEVEQAGREGLTPTPAGKVRLPYDCPPKTMWDGMLKTCVPLDSRDKEDKSGGTMMQPGMGKSSADYDSMSIAKVIQQLDEIIKENAAASKEKARTVARNLPNEAFPPSLVGSTRRSLMHHSPDVADAYDTASVDLPRLRNALARVESLEGYSPKAIEDARDHLLYHAKEILKDRLGKS